MRSALIEPFFATLKAANPQPSSELEYSSVFELLVAVLQAYVFAILTAVYIQLALAEEH